MFSVVHGNVLGAVIAPKGCEDLPKGGRAFIWRVSIRPLVSEVAEHEEFPAADAKRVAMELFDYCKEEGVAIPMNDQ